MTIRTIDFIAKGLFKKKKEFQDNMILFGSYLKHGVVGNSNGIFGVD